MEDDDGSSPSGAELGKRRLQVREASRRFRSRKKSENAFLSARIELLVEENQMLRDEALAVAVAGGGGGGPGDGDSNLLREVVSLRTKLRTSEEALDMALAATALLLPTTKSRELARSSPTSLPSQAISRTGSPVAAHWPSSSSPPHFILPSPAVPSWPLHHQHYHPYSGERQEREADEVSADAGVDEVASVGAVEAVAFPPGPTFAATVATTTSMSIASSDSAWGSLVKARQGEQQAAGVGGYPSARVGFAAHPAEALLAESRILLASAARDVGAFIGERGWLPIWRSSRGRGSVREADAPVASTLVEIAHSRASASRLADAAWQALVAPVVGAPSALSGLVTGSRSLLAENNVNIDSHNLALVERTEILAEGPSRLLIVASRIGPISRSAAIDFLAIDSAARALAAADGGVPGPNDSVYLGVARTVDIAVATAHGFTSTAAAAAAASYAGYTCVTGACRFFTQVDVPGRVLDRTAHTKATMDFAASLLATALLAPSAAMAALPTLDTGKSEQQQQFNPSLPLDWEQDRERVTTSTNTRTPRAIPLPPLSALGLSGGTVAHPTASHISTTTVVPQLDLFRLSVHPGGESLIPSSL